MALLIKTTISKLFNARRLVDVHWCSTARLSAVDNKLQRSRDQILACLCEKFAVRSPLFFLTSVLTNVLRATKELSAIGSTLKLPTEIHLESSRKNLTPEGKTKLLNRKENSCGEKKTIVKKENFLDRKENSCRGKKTPVEKRKLLNRK